MDDTSISAESLNDARDRWYAAKQVLLDNGTDANEVDAVLTALCYALVQEDDMRFFLPLMEV